MNLETTIKELIIWLIFTVSVSLLPLIIDYMIRIIKTQNNPSLEDLTDGQLLLIAVALGAEAIGSVLFKGQNYSVDEIIIIGVSFLILLFASFLYPSIIDLKQSQRLQSPRFVLKVTLVLFSLSLTFSFACKWISLRQ